MQKFQAIQAILLSVSLLLAFLALILIGVVNRKRPGVKKKKIAVYVICYLIVFGLILVIGDLTHTDPMTVFLLTQGAALIGGILHTWLMYKIFPWAKRDGFGPELLFTSSVMLLAAFGLLSISVWREWNTLGAALCTALIPFVIPYLVVKSFDAMWAIPALRYKLWFYPMGMEVPNPLDFDLSDHMKVIAIEFSPREGEEPLNIKVKAPERMEIGHYFMTFIEQFDIRNPERTVEITDDSNMPVGWLFYLKQPWYKSARVLDGEMTFNDNKVNENDTIIAERVYETH
jgi:hypothetical protein